MPQSARAAFTSTLFAMLLAIAGCATKPVAAEGEVVVEGAIASIDTAPWAYDGNAAIQIDTRDRGRVAVHLPARWNLCKAAPVDVQALAVGMQVRAVGAPGAEGEVVVCQETTHRLAPK